MSPNVVEAGEPQRAWEVMLVFRGRLVARGGEEALALARADLGVREEGERTHMSLTDVRARKIEPGEILGPRK